MVRRVETGAGVGLLHYELAAVLVTDQEQHWLPMRYPPAVSRRHGQVLGLDDKQTGLGIGRIASRPEDVGLTALSEAVALAVHLR